MKYHQSPLIQYFNYYKFYRAVYGIIIFSIVSCSDGSPLDAILMSPGTLGVSATEDLACTETDVEYAIDDLLDSGPFAIPEKDSSAVNWWSEVGYDFLNYRCILNLQQKTGQKVKLHF